MNVDAPRGGRIVTQLPQWHYNQNPQTFNTLNMYVLRGDGAAGMGLTFATPDGGVHRRARQRLWPRREGSGDLRRPQGDCASSCARKPPSMTARRSRPRTWRSRSRCCATRGIPNIAADLRGIGDIGVEDEHTLARHAETATRRGACRYGGGGCRSSRAPGGRDRDFEASLSEAPLGSGPYKVGDLSFGSYIEFERVADWWARRPAGHARALQLRSDPLRILSRPHRLLRSLQEGQHHVPRGVHLAATGRRATIFRR